MRKSALTSMILVIAMVALVLVSLDIRSVRASPDYNIERIAHEVQVLYNGYIFINDTIRIAGDAPTEFMIGFPYAYSSHVLRCIAYNATETYTVNLDAQLEGRAGFYGVKVDFPQGAPQEFTVGFILGNSLLVQSAQNASHFTLYFPQYPSVTKAVANCTVYINVPEGANIIGGSVDRFRFSRANLPAFTHSPTNMTFMLTSDRIQKVDIREMSREIWVNEFGDAGGSDAYYIKNEGTKALSSVDVILPINASITSAQDQFGRSLSSPTEVDKRTSRYKVLFSLPIEISESSRFSVNYALPKEVNKKLEGTSNFALNITLYQNMIAYVHQTSTTLVLPEGARILDLRNFQFGDSYGVSQSVYTQAAALGKQSVFSLDSFNMGLVYEYNPFWLSFRPTLWMWIVSICGCVVVGLLRRHKAPARAIAPTSAVRIRPENLKSLVDAYEEKMKISLELDSLEAKVQKGKIPRRRYKVQKKTLEMRLATLSRTVAELKERMRAAGGHYSELNLQLEIAESELSEVETAVKSLEALHNRGELSLEAYRKRLDDYQRRKEKSETTINGILIRLREEMR